MDEATAADDSFKYMHACDEFLSVVEQLSFLFLHYFVKVATVLLHTSFVRISLALEEEESVHIIQEIH